MVNEREKNFKSLSMTDFKIGDDVFRVYYTPDGDFVFVIDNLISDTKPNVLLVIDPDGDRKWDDILENDYGIDLETIRPKKDNKYQKLDIEYSGLNLYNDLVQAYLDDEDTTNAAQALHAFRNESVKRAVQERLKDAIETVERAGDTIDKTNEKISQLKQNIKELHAKLADARGAIGKEPTKQSASKILRLESLIDVNEEKLKRAKKRLANAKHRLDVAGEDVVNAQNLLAKLNVNLPAQPVHTDVAITPSTPVPAIVDDDDKTEFETETKADDMADEDVKPLFDTDPDILDEEIAFKPIEFDADAVRNVPAVTPENNLMVRDVAEPMFEQDDDDFNDDDNDDEEEEMEIAPAPLSFAPPSSFDDAGVQKDDTIKPMFEGFTDFPEMEEQKTETTAWTPVSEKPVQDVLAPVVPEPASEVAPAPISTEFRPVSPIRNETADVKPVVSPVVPVSNNQMAHSKPTILYYFLLIVLIVLSVFTLWFYQKTTNDNMPELESVSETFAVVEEPVVEPEPEPVVVPEPVIEEPVIEEPVVEPEPVVEEPVIEEPVVEPVIEPEPVVEPEPAEKNPFANLPADAIVGPVPTLEPEEKIIVPTEEEVLSAKPEYGVSQQEKMFVADDNYETETVVESVEPTIIRAPQQPQYTEQLVVKEEVDVCAGGDAPDRYGCCPGEEFVLLPDGERACCAESTGECFPPM